MSHLLLQAAPRFLALYSSLLHLPALPRNLSAPNSLRPLLALLFAQILLLLYAILGLICLSNYTCPTVQISYQLSASFSYLAYLLVDLTSTRTVYTHLARRRKVTTRRVIESLTHLLHLSSNSILHASIFIPLAHHATSILLTTSAILPLVVSFLVTKVDCLKSSNPSPSATESLASLSTPIPKNKLSPTKALFLVNQSLALAFSLASFWPGTIFDVLGGFALILRSAVCGLMVIEFQKLRSTREHAPSSSGGTFSAASTTSSRSRSLSDSTIRDRPRPPPFYYPQAYASAQAHRGRNNVPSSLNPSSEDFLNLRDPFASPVNGRSHEGYPPSPPRETNGHFGQPPPGPCQPGNGSSTPRKKRARRGTVPLPASVNPNAQNFSNNSNCATSPIFAPSRPQNTRDRDPRGPHRQLSDGAKPYRSGSRYSSSTSLASLVDKKLTDEVDPRFLQRLLLYSLSNGSWNSFLSPS